MFWALVVGPTARARLPSPGMPESLPLSQQKVPPTIAPQVTAPPITAPPVTAEATPSREAVPEIITVQSGDSLMSLLQHAGITPAAAQSAIDALAGKWDPRALKIGQEIALLHDDAGVKQLHLTPDLQREIVLTRGTDGNYIASVTPREILTVPLRIAGSIDSSLFEAAAKAGMPQAVLSDVIHAFSYDVDFQREVQPGDSFEVLFDQLVDEKTGKIVGTGDLAYAALNLSGKLEMLYRYTPHGGYPGFYSADGTNVKKALLRTPVDGARISSSFGMRHHPILGFTRMHQGVDFAVPAGTPIMASGDGVIASAGWAGGYGNMIVLRHNGTYSTAYGHMSHIAKGIKAGVHVHQGEVIGYVGMTGLATGPHLHYEVRVDNKQINPLGVRLAATRKLEGRDLANFRAQEIAVAKRVAALRNNSKVAKN
ncbi:MAG TPA: peptidoglycan DD-metalloendopeptidase family protein [Stellaceae bacterium]|nr:peptidoglycan DD-metalloendopeptidase family protein [Stellaceae bacterium]